MNSKRYIKQVLKGDLKEQEKWEPDLGGWRKDQSVDFQSHGFSRRSQHVDHVKQSRKESFSGQKLVAFTLYHL